jgi:hypothetical protein
MIFKNKFPKNKMLLEFNPIFNIGSGESDVNKSIRVGLLDDQSTILCCSANVIRSNSLENIKNGFGDAKSW